MSGLFLILGLASWVVVGLWAWSLCAAASDADDRLEQYERERHQR